MQVHTCRQLHGQAYNFLPHFSSFQSGCYSSACLFFQGSKKIKLFSPTFRSLYGTSIPAKILPMILFVLIYKVYRVCLSTIADSEKIYLVKGEIVGKF